LAPEVVRIADRPESPLGHLPSGPDAARELATHTGQVGLDRLGHAGLAPVSVVAGRQLDRDVEETVGRR
jgi:imidazolonepropionase-like amidohydrolase